MGTLKYVHRNKTSFKINWLFAVIALLAAGMIYRIQASRLKLIISKPLTLSTPLKSLPFEINDWVGRDIPIPENIQRVTGNDDFVNRFYVNKSTNQWANIYIAYSGQPRSMLGHRPQVCYVAGGWIHDNTRKEEFVNSAGNTLVSLIHNFHKPDGAKQEVVVLSFYIVNGQVICNEKGFSGLGWRTPNVTGKLAQYVGHVQISSVLENSVLAAAKDMSELILGFFSDSNSTVKVSEHSEPEPGDISLRVHGSAEK